MENEYILDTENKNSDVFTKPTLDGLTAEEAIVMKKMEELSDYCVEKQIPFFLATKFSNQEDPNSVWFFGNDEVIAHKTFIENFAALLLYVTSQMTLTTIKAYNPSTGNIVYETNPTPVSK